MENNSVQVVLVKDINPGINNYGYANSSYPYNFTEFEDKLYFSANFGELWVSDGTAEGTQLLVDINPNNNYGYGYSSYPEDLTEFNSKLYFSANFGELWVSDGTAEGTQLLVDINGFSFSDFQEFNDKLYFTVNGDNGDELWVSDGTAEGTQLLVDISLDSNYGSAFGSNSGDFTQFNNKLYFNADDGENGRELWVSDGTAEGTQLLLDINPGSSSYYGYTSVDSSYPYSFTEFNDKLYFSADDGENGRELWVSDGTTEGTQLLLDIYPGIYYGDYGTYVNSSSPSDFIEFNDKLYFSASNEKNGRELWVTDGTVEGTQLLVDINFEGSYGYGSSYPYSLTEFNGKLYFTADDGENGNELWATDGTVEGTQLVADINTPKSPGFGFSSSPYGFTEFNGKLYFTADDGENGRELWISDGTAQGTQLLVDINSSNSYGSAYSSYASDFTEFNGKLYFNANDGENGRELWVSDGTAEGTQLLLDINSDISSQDGSYASDFTEFNGKLYFNADDGENGDELWVSDGTAEGTQLLVDINPGSSYSYYGYTSVNSSSPFGFTEFNNKLYFSAGDGENGRELWVTDGTAEGTQLLLDINPGSSYSYYGGTYPNGSYASDLTEFNDKLYFSANDGENGNELWVSDGTAEGTQLLLDINSTSSYSYYGDTYPNSSYASGFTEFNDKLYFSANDGENGNELWVSDGTAEGTQLLLDINPGSSNYGYAYSSYPGGLTELDGKLYFSASTEENGRELWVSDGTTEGTQLVADIDPRNFDYGYRYGSYADNLTVVGDELFFSADDGENGRELFKLTFDDISDPVNIIVGTNGSDNLTGTEGADSIEGFDGRDTIVGADANDTLLGGNDRDLLKGGVGNDSLIGEQGKDTLNGGEGNDILLGGDRQDSLIGGAGDDRLMGEEGRDTLIGGMGDDTLTGGEGKDIFVLAVSEGSDTIVDFQLGSDRIGLANGLEREDLSFSGNTIQAGDELLAIVNGVNTEDLIGRDFVFA